MKPSHLSLWRFAVAAWIGVIFFSSTSLASEWCERLFSYLSALLFASIRPTTPSYEWIHLGADKGLHVTLFLILALLLWRAIPPARGKVVAVLLTGLVVGSCSEFLQNFFPGRDPAIRDVLINVAGTAIGVIISLRVFESPRYAATPG